MLRAISILFCLSCSALLASCATYVPPTSGKMATVAFVGEHRYAYVDEGFSCESRHMVGEQYWSGAPVRAGQRIWIEQGFDTRGTPYGVFCGLAYTFVPEEGARYVSEYIRQSGQCQLTLYRLSSQDEKVREPTLKREAPRRC
jgi:hypothetical protein